MKLAKQRRHDVAHLVGAEGGNERGTWTACRLWSPVRAVRDVTGRMARPLAFAVEGRPVTCERCRRLLRLRDVNFPPVPLDRPDEISLRKPD